MHYTLLLPQYVLFCVHNIKVYVACHSTVNVFSSLHEAATKSLFDNPTTYKTYGVCLAAFCMEKLSTPCNLWMKVASNSDFSKRTPNTNEYICA